MLKTNPSESKRTINIFWEVYLDAKSHISYLIREPSNLCNHKQSYLNLKLSMKTAYPYMIYVMTLPITEIFVLVITYKII